MQVVVVESPAKAKTINKYLGKDFTVLASYGHVRDLPPKDGSVDPEADFDMKWQVQSGADKRLKDIKRTKTSVVSDSTYFPLFKNSFVPFINERSAIGYLINKKPRSVATKTADSVQSTSASFSPCKLSNILGINCPNK